MPIHSNSTPQNATPRFVPVAAFALLLGVAMLLGGSASARTGSNAGPGTAPAIGTPPATHAGINVNHLHPRHLLIMDVKRRDLRRYRRVC